MISKIAFYYLFWIALSGIFEPFFLIAGFIAVLLSQKFYDKSINSKRLFQLTKYYIFLFTEVIKSAYYVIMNIYKPIMDYKSNFGYVKHNLKRHSSIALFANSITLTPGTITVSIEKEHILVHALREQDLLSIEDSDMHKKIMKMDKYDI